MADKQIMINGIDVSECEYCLKMIKHRCTIQQDVYKCLCEGNPNCHYKQLKRKEQECEKAKQNAQDTHELYQALMESFNILQGEKIKLEQECERLRFPMPDTNYAILTKEEFEQLDKLKVENDSLKSELMQTHCYLDADKETIDQLKGVIKKYEECNKYLVEENGKIYTRLEYKLLRTLTEMKPILDFYANSNMGEEQSNGTYKILANGLCITIYDPKPARQGLQKISEIIPNEN